MSNRRLNSNDEEPKTCPSNIYKSNQGQKCYFTNNFMSKSANRLLNDSKVLYVNDVVMNRYSNNNIQENSTQTSKTILQLAKIEAQSMSTDSLIKQPKDPRPVTVTDSIEIYHEHLRRQCSCDTLDGSCSEPYTIEQTRRYFGSHIPPSDSPKTIAEKAKCLEKSLATIFLEKAKHKLVHEKCSSNTFEDELTRPPPVKSKSFVDDYHHPNYVFDPLPKKNESSTKNLEPRRHSWKNRVLIDLPDNSCLLRQSSSICSKNPTTFMSPTTAFQIKNKMPEIQIINQLIPPTRRGRSISPKLCEESKDLSSKSKDRVPYIDQSKTTLKSSSTILVNLARDAITDESKNKFEHSLGTIDEMSNTAKSSCGNLSLISNADYSSTDNTISIALNKLCDEDWNVAVRGLAEIVELCRFVDLQHMAGHMRNVYRRLIELLKSPRSYVCRIACQATGHLFEYVKDTRRPEFDDIVDLLLSKTADANKFIRHDANLALDCMVTHLPIFHSIRAVCSKGPLHKNPLVRTASARLLICAVVIAGPDFVLNPNNNEYTRNRVFSSMGLFLDDKNLETRKFGERLYKVLCKESRFDTYLKKYLDKEQCDKVKRNLKLVRKKM